MPAVRDTISDILAVLRFNLEEGLNDLAPMPDNTDDDRVVLGNIAFHESSDTAITAAIGNRIVLTLVKTEEEYAMKNQPNHRRNPVSGNLEYANPPIFLNLYVLITANVVEYEVALSFLSRVISYFQHQNVFNETNTVAPSGGVVPETFQFNVSMVSPGLEQLNHLWGVLGGKIMPSVFYKLQLQQIEYIPDEPLPASPITEITLTEQIH
ncbi:MAG TPA: DUF4255 domain-containing protein [Pricia sp.]|nr:DUF4255 domain-containing protein [Pricia sp.]